MAPDIDPASWDHIDEEKNGLGKGKYFFGVHGNVSFVIYMSANGIRIMNDCSLITGAILDAKDSCFSQKVFINLNATLE